MAAVVISPADRSLPCRVPGPVVERPRPRSVPDRASAAGRRRLDAAVYWRRRIVVLVIAVFLLALFSLGITRAVQGMVAWRSTAPASPAIVEPAGSAVAIDETADVYVVQPGDTLWSIAGQIAPGDDPRPIVDRLAAQAGGSALRPGQRVSLAGVR